MPCRLLMTLAVIVAVAETASDAHAQTPCKITPDLVYGHKDGLAMTMDLFQPEQPNGATIAFMVSGGWFSRWIPPEQAKGFFEPYLAKGYSILAIRHGSSPKYGIPDAVADVRRGIRYVHSRAGELNVDVKRLGVLGMSAGGHLSLMLATTGDDGDPNSPDPILRFPSRVTAVAALVPPTDLRVAVWEAEESLPAYRNFPALDMKVSEAAKYSPVTLISQDDAPSLVISGLKDDLVPPRHGEWIEAACKQGGVECKLLLLDADHGLQGKQPEAIGAVLEWFGKKLAAKP